MAKSAERSFRGELIGYKFTARFEDEKKDGEWIYFVPQIKPDGEDDPVHLRMFLGAADRYEIGDDGKSLTMADGSLVSYGFSTPFGRFMETLLDTAEKAGIDIVDELPNLAEGEALNLEALVGLRYRFKEEVDEEGTKKFGKRTGTGKNKGKEFDRTNTVIAEVLENRSHLPHQSETAEERDQVVENAVVELLNVAVVLRKFKGGSVTECRMCGGQDENHTSACAVPALEEWINPSDL